MLGEIEKLPEIIITVKADVSGKHPDIKWVSPERLYTDKSYQRNITRKSQKVIRSIAKTFTWARFGIVVCVPHPDIEDAYIIIDGQHRATAAKALELPAIPCLITTQTSAAEQASHFVGINTDRVNLTPAAIFKARYKAADPEISELIEDAKASGVRILMSNYSSLQMRPGDTMAYSVLMNWHKRDKETLKVALEALNKRKPVTAPELNGACTALTDGLFKTGLDSERLAEVADRFTTKELWRLMIKHRVRTGDTTPQSWAVVIWRVAMDIQDEKELP